MGESKPVSRRESAFGTPEDDEIRPHRCNDRAEDVIQAFFEGNALREVPQLFKLFWRCMRSKPGEEPIEPYKYVKVDPPHRDMEFE